MILMYLLVLMLLATGHWVAGRRARSLERRYVRVASEADVLAKELTQRPGNSNKPDLYTTAKRQYELGRLVETRDRLEAKYASWEARRERYRQRTQGLRGWKGQFVPYLFGIADLVMVVGTLLFTGVIDPTRLSETVENFRAFVAR